MTNQKPVILVIVDALASRIVVPAIQDGRLPHLAALCQAGVLREESLAVFPSLTPTASSSLLTGVYPAAHGVFGFHWFDRTTDQEVYYGDDFWVIAKKGFAEFFFDGLGKLNAERLLALTGYQRVESSGRTSASLNFLIFKGDHPHTATVPPWLSWHPDIPREHQVYGPGILFFGDLVDGQLPQEEELPDRPGGPFARFGFNDGNTGELLLSLADSGDFPDFTVAYFPDNDWSSHEVGPTLAFEKVIAVDQMLGQFFAKLGGLEQALEKVCLMLTGDHSQSEMHSDPGLARISVENLLKDYRLAPVGSWSDERTIKVCPDMRCLQIFIRKSQQHLRAELTEVLLEDHRVDQLFYNQGHRAVVQTFSRGALAFWPTLDAEESAIDLYGNRWAWEGSLETVDARVEDGLLLFGDYPNAFERIWGCLSAPDTADLWVTSYPGSEFAIPETSVHVGGGSHGSLHRLDSVSPLIIAGHRSNLEIPKQPRSVDVLPLCLQQLGVETELAGLGHYRRTRQLTKSGR